MEFSEALARRRSIRAFQSTPVAPALLDELLGKACLAPSWSNTQPYQLAVAQGAVLERLRSELPRRFDRVAHLQRAPMLTKLSAWLRRDGLPDGDFKPLLNYPEDLQPRRLATGRALYELLGIGRDDHQARHQQMRENFRFFSAPVAIFVFIHDGLGVYSALDAGIFLQNLMLAATDAGLGSCAQGALALWRSPLEAHFQLPPNYKLLCGVSLGYPAEEPINTFQPDKLPLSSLLIKPR